MKILITGGTGFIGHPLCVELTKEGHELTLVSRNPTKYQENWGLPSQFLKWDMEHELCPVPLDAFDAVVHLAGESLAGGLWTQKQKKKILMSRTESTKALSDAIALRKVALPLFLSASAIGIFPSSPDQTFVEESRKGEGFLAEVCKAWEKAVTDIPNVTRELRLRFGLVLGDGGGFLGKLELPSRLGLGAVLGNGQQWVSWVHRSDIINIVKVALRDESYKGPINVVAPETVTQKQLQRMISQLLHRPVFLRVPAVILQTVLGDFSHLALDSQKVVPHRLQQLGYTFLYPGLKEALTEALSLHVKNGKTFACHRLEAAQFVDRPIGEVFEFFCDPRNLEKITPPLLSFKIAHISSPEVKEGTVIDYKLKVHGMPMRWKTLIKNWQKNDIFVDNQESGPYSIWHHTHKFFAVQGGTLMTDQVLYRLPMGTLGDCVALPLVKRDVRQIFGYRRQVIAREFPKLVQ